MPSRIDIETFSSTSHLGQARAARRSRATAPRGADPASTDRNLSSPVVVRSSVNTVSAESTVRVSSSHNVKAELVRLPPRFDVSPHAHVLPHVLVQLDGSVLERDGRRSVFVDAGGSRLSPAGDSHTISSGDGGATCLVLHVEPGLLAASGGLRVGDRKFIHSRWIRRRGVELLAEIALPAGGSPLIADQLAIEIVAQATRPRRSTETAGPPPWLEDACDALRETYADPPTLSELAALVGRHPMHVARAFRRHLGCTAGAYLRTHRLETARRLLVGTDRSLSEVAYGCGFSDQSHMTRLFRARLGVTPGDLRAGRGS